MAGHHFISYSRLPEAEAFAFRLYNALQAGPPPHAVWLDQRDLSPATDWDEQIVEALRTCNSLLFVMTRDSVEPQSGCKLEWTRALKYKKPVLPLLLHRDAEQPFRPGQSAAHRFFRRLSACVSQIARLPGCTRLTSGRPPRHERSDG